MPNENATVATDGTSTAQDTNTATPQSPGADPTSPSSNQSSNTQQPIAIRVNAGGGDYVDTKGNKWSADTGFNTGAIAPSTAAINGTDDDLIYQSNRFDWGTSPELSYAFKVPNGDYLVNLHFAETWSGAWAVGKRIFGVKIEGQSVESGLDVFAAVGANTALVKSYTATVSDGLLQIDFVHGVENPFVSGIDVLGPVARTGGSPLSAQDGSSISINVLTSYPNLTAPVVTLAGDPAHGTASIGTNNTIVYVADKGYAGTDTILYTITGSNGETILATASVQVTCASCPAERTLTLSWNPNTDTVTGYQVFRGPTAEQATQLVSDLPLNSGLVNPTAPQVQYRSQSDLGLSSGQQACFRVKAYKDSSFSGYSQAVCGVI